MRDLVLNFEILVFCVLLICVFNYGLDEFLKWYSNKFVKLKPSEYVQGPIRRVTFASQARVDLPDIKHVVTLSNTASKKLKNKRPVKKTKRPKRKSK